MGGFVVYLKTQNFIFFNAIICLRKLKKGLGLFSSYKNFDRLNCSLRIFLVPIESKIGRRKAFENFT